MDMHHDTVETEPTEIKCDATEKRARKFTLKGISMVMERLQKERKCNFVQAGKLKTKITTLLASKENASIVQQNLKRFKGLCQNASELHNTLLTELPLPEEELRKQEAWFHPKKAVNDIFIEEIAIWLKENGIVLNDDDDVDDDDYENAKSECQDDINPGDSVSNVSSRRSQSKSSVSSISSACIKARAEKAALMEQVAALQKRHNLEAQEEKLRKMKEQLELDTEIAAAAARLSVLEGSDVGGKAHSDGMSSYVSKGLKQQRLEFNPKANAFVPKMNTLTSDQDSRAQPFSSTRVVRPKVNMQTDLQDQVQRHGTSQTKDITLGLQSQPNTGLSHTTTLRQKSQNVYTASTAASLRTVATEEQGLHRLQSAQNTSPVHTVDQDAICEIMQKQNEITTMLVQQQMSASLPQRDIIIFDGDPLKYISFIRAFENCIEARTSSYQDCVYFLEQYTRGQPRELVRSCLHMTPQQGYQRAKGLLKEHFGNEHRIATAYMDKAFGWPVVKTEDVQTLQEFALFLRGCCNTMTEIKYMEEMNIPSNMRHVIMKWPYKLRERWRSAACGIEERRGYRALFPDMVNFLEKQVKILSHPLFGDISDAQPNTLTIAINRSKPLPRNSIKGSSFATTITVHETPNPVTAKESSSESCLYCQEPHPLSRCSKLNKASQWEKIEFLKGKGICFGCLKAGHMSKECKSRLTCEECNLKHPTILHIQDKDKTNKPQEIPVNSALVSLQACGCTGAGDQDCTLSIVPVQLKSKKGGKVLQTYAFLDPGITATFCTNRLMKKLNLQGTKTNIMLRTMGQEKVVESQILAGLEVSKLDDNQFFELPETFTQETIPVSKGNIPTQRDIERWEYLKEISTPELNADVEILIGTNAPKLMEPWGIINSQGDGPYAVRTLLGWVVNGPLRGNSGCCQKSCSTIYANRISIVRLEELLVSQYNQDFNEKSLEENQEMSMEDLRFMETLEKSTCMQEGHYCMDLPFKVDDITMPNNRCIVEQRIQSLKRKFERNKTYQEEYTAFLTEMIDSGYAEVVPKDQLDCKAGSVWYLPHHGVYHPKKKTLRVVFDCGAGFKGTSLNGQLLQGPDLTNSLFGVLTKLRQENVALMTDVKAMFHQVKVSEKHIDFLRFLWWPTGDMSQNPIEHRMRVHIFGAVSSPSCANYALKRTAVDNKDDFKVEVTDAINNNFYVDDCLQSLPTKEEAMQLVMDLTDICSKGGFQLLKWTSNSRAVLSSIPEAKRSKTTRQLHLEQDNLPVEMALGLNWCAQSDTFTFKHLVETRPHTRRGILSIASSIYDPLGFLSPFTLLPKLLLQEMCRKNMSWDDPIPQTLSQQWTGWLLDLEKVTELKVDRCIKPKDFRGPIHAQLHHFADASDHGYGTVSYLRLENQYRNVHLAFMLDKGVLAATAGTTKVDKAAEKFCIRGHRRCHGSNCPSWIMGRVIKIYPDKRGLVRAVQLKTKTGQLERPISKIFLLQEAV